jgi:hypothetical protein
MPYRRIPKIMVNAIVERAIRGLNQFPARDGVSDTISPLTIMMGMPGPDYNACKLEFGGYVQVFEANDPTNHEHDEVTYHWGHRAQPECRRRRRI